MNDDPGNQDFQVPPGMVREIRLRPAVLVSTRKAVKDGARFAALGSSLTPRP
jgi:hypothetical protein